MHVPQAGPLGLPAAVRPPDVVSVRRAVGTFLAAGLLVVLALGAVLAVVQHRTATKEAVRDATALTSSQARLLGASLTRDALVPGPAWDALDVLVRERVLDDRIVRVKIWDEDGRVLYSDDPSIVGHQFQLAAEEREALRTGSTVAEVSELEEAENTGEDAEFGRLLQVYLGLRTPDGQAVLLETYQPYEEIVRASERLWSASLPVLFGGLGLLYLLQVPLAYRMATRLRTVQEERERLLVASLAGADREKAQIAADLHDGVVQGLAGASYTLSAAAVAVRSAGQPLLADTVHAAAVDLRRWVRELRSLIVSVAPPAARHAGLEPALVDLVGSVDAHGLTVALSVDGALTDLEGPTGSLVYRVVQEALRNVVRHGSATRVDVRVCVKPDALELLVEDDGGLAGDGVLPAGQGLGLELLTSLAAAHGGQLQVFPRAPTGNVVRLALPLRRPAPDPEEGADLDLTRLTTM